MITFLKFARAHTIVGTSLSIIALYVLAARTVGEYDGLLLVWTLFSCLAANVYITGLNQLTDVEIDRINKPYLPLASGDYSMRTGRAIVLICLALSVVSAIFFWPYLVATVGLSLLLGTAYSLPPLRLKRFHFWAAFCILAVRGLIVNLLLFLHFRYYLGGGHEVTTSVFLLTAIIFTFSIIIAWFKDLPDTEGDAAYNINTLSLRLGRKKVWRYGSGLLIFTLVMAAILGFAVLQSIPVAGGQLGLLGLLLYFGTALDLDDQASIARYYQRIWILFFAEYLIFALFG